MEQRRGLDRMLEARSVAVVGASGRPGSSGRQMIHQLVAGGFEGPIAPVNPKYDELEGRECFPSLTAVPFDVDLAVLGVPNSALESELTKVAECGIPSAVIFASGYEDDPGDHRLIDTLRRIARDGNITICGGNCMGFANFEKRLRALAFEEEEDLEPGPITWITHSGSAFTALLHNRRRLRFNLAISAGQEMTTTVADYLEYAAGKRSTSVIALFLEAVRDPERFRSALDRAKEADVPVVALKVGRTDRSQELVRAHSGALAGQDAVFQAMFEAHDVIAVGSMNEMADVLELLVAGRRAAGGGLGSVHDSGGERAHLIDVAAGVGTELAVVSDRTKERLAAVLEPGLPPVNPVDAWGTGNDFEKIFLECFRALDDDDSVGALAFSVDLAGEDLEWGYADVAEQIFRETVKPFAVMSNLTSAIDSEAADRLRSAGVPVLEDTVTGLRAFKHLFEMRDRAELPPVTQPDPVDRDVTERWIARLSASPKPTEVEGLEMLADYGIPVAPSSVVDGRDQAVEAAHAIGWPVVLKIVGHDHKTEAGGVVLSIADEAQLAAAYDGLAQRWGPAVVVQKMAEPGVEMALGIVRDDQFGPALVVAAGGVLVETIGDRRLVLPPLDPARAHRMLAALEVRRLFEGVRGSPPVDVDGLVTCMIRLSRLAADLGDRLDGLDVNPLVVGPTGAVAVDALVVPRRVTEVR